MSQDPARFGKYPVLRILGHGSSGTVYEASEPSLGRRVAIKALLPELAREPEVRLRFRREVEVVSALHHPNVVRVFDSGEEAGRPWLAMELIEGSDLAALLHAGPPPVEWAIDILRQLCDGLGYAHRLGVVHRDVKPSNVRVTPAGDVKLVDFGIARVPGSSLTARGVALGSVQYLAPEQIVGGEVDARADVFAVGVLAFEMLSGRRPFEADTLPATLARIAETRVDGSLLPLTAYSRSLEAVVLKALARDPEARFASFDGMRTALAEVVKEAAGRRAAAR
ncbi:MAG: serine/threonine-protein kinase [Vicinamibacteria bacterium]